MHLDKNKKMWAIPSNRPSYSDLCVRESFNFVELKNIENLGFKTIAIECFVEENTLDNKKNKKRKGEVKDKQDPFPAPSERSKLDCSMNMLQRITIEFSDSGVSHKMNQSENLKKYDLIAVVPKTLSAFQFACGSMDIDIITFNPESKLPFKMSRKLYKQAADRGIFFELMYAPAIKDSTSRKNIINTAHQYHSIGKSKNIILSSAAENHMQVRGIYDLMNLGHILGLNDHQCREVLTVNPRKVLLKSEVRRCGKSFLYIRTITEDEDLESKHKKIKLQ